jgi:hypothetical protein
MNEADVAPAPLGPSTPPVSVVPAAPAADPAAASQQKDAGARPPEGPAVPANGVVSMPPAGPLSLQKIGALWQNVSTRVASQKGSLKATLTHTRVTALDGDTLTLTVPDKVRGELLKADLAVVRSAINGVLGHPLEIRIVVENGRAAPAVGAAQPDAEPIDLVRYANERLP